MKKVFVDANGRTVQVSEVTIGKNFSSGVCEGISGIVRVKNIGEDMGIVRLQNKSGDGIYFSAGETEYLAIPEGEKLEVVSGEFNIMF